MKITTYFSLLFSNEFTLSWREKGVNVTQHIKMDQEALTFENVEGVRHGLPKVESCLVNNTDI